MQYRPSPAVWGSLLASVTGLVLILVGLILDGTPAAAQAAGDSPSATAFRALLPTLQHPRCANCHGAFDVFAANTAHPGGQVTPAPNDDNPFGGGCADSGCHTAPLPDGTRWRQPSTTDTARWAGKSPAQLCTSIKAGRLTAAQMIEHVRTDGLVTAGFAAQRGGAADRADPPPMTQAQFVSATQRWIDAMGADKWSDAALGCPAVLTGTWNSSYGRTEVTQPSSRSVTGSTTYTNGNTGQLTGTFDGQNLTYTWSNAADHGDGSLALSSDGCTLDGYFIQASDGTRGDWTLYLNQCGAAPSGPPPA